MLAVTVRRDEEVPSRDGSGARTCATLGRSRCALKQPAGRQCRGLAVSQNADGVKQPAELDRLVEVAGDAQASRDLGQVALAGEEDDRDGGQGRVLPLPLPKPVHGKKPIPAVAQPIAERDAGSRAPESLRQSGRARGEVLSRAANQAR